jgi:hypothetical protein
MAKQGLIKDIDKENPMEALLFGALILAVNPVATLSIMGNADLQVNESDAFVDHTRYPYCREYGHIGRPCFINDFSAEEEYGDLERAAIAKFQSTANGDEDIVAELKNKLSAFRFNPFNATALDYLLTFAHIARVMTNIRAHMHDVYMNHTITIDHSNGNGTINGNLLHVSMHVSPFFATHASIKPAGMKEVPPLLIHEHRWDQPGCVMKHPYT